MLRIIPPPRDRSEELFDLAAKVFGGGGYFDFLRFCRRSYFAGSSYDWSASRVAELAGRLVGHVGVWRYRMRIGRARALAGGLGAVLTHGEHRRRGIAAKVLPATLEAMRQAGYHFAALGGIRNFYHRWGFTQAWPSRKLFADVAQLPADGLRLTLRQVPLTEALCGTGAVMRIYNRDNATRTGTAERPLYTRPGGQWLAGRCTTLRDAAGGVRGYFVTVPGGDDLTVVEAGGLGRGCGVGQLLAAMRTLARRRRCRRVVLEGFSQGHPLCAALRRGTCRVEMQHTRSGRAMNAVVSLRGGLEAMTGELSVRLAGSHLARFKGTLAVEGVGEKVCLRLSGGKVKLAPGAGRTAHRISAGPDVARMLIGSEPPSVLAAQSGVRFRGAADELAEVLFPHQWPMRYALDGF